MSSNNFDNSEDYFNDLPCDEYIPDVDNLTPSIANTVLTSDFDKIYRDLLDSSTNSKIAFDNQQGTKGCINQKTIQEKSGKELAKLVEKIPNLKLQTNEQTNGNIRRPRTIFTSQQIIFMENVYKEFNYLSREQRIYVATSLKLSEGTVKVWFQNRRTKDRRVSSKGHPLREILQAQFQKCVTFSSTPNWSNCGNATPPSLNQYEFGNQRENAASFQQTFSNSLVQHEFGNQQQNAGSFQQTFPNSLVQHEFGNQQQNAGSFQQIHPNLNCGYQCQNRELNACNLPHPQVNGTYTPAHTQVPDSCNDDSDENSPYSDVNQHHTTNNDDDRWQQ